jgi:hypothetical protein
MRQSAPDTIHINRNGISNIVSLEDLWRHIALSSSHQTRYSGYIPNLTTQSSVAKFHLPIRSEENVLWLDVEVDIAVSMHFRYEKNELLD